MEIYAHGAINLIAIIIIIIINYCKSSQLKAGHKW